MQSLIYHHYTTAPIDYWDGVLSLEEIRMITANRLKEGSKFCTIDNLAEIVERICDELTRELGVVLRHDPFIVIEPRPVDPAEIKLIFFKEHCNGDTHIFSLDELEKDYYPNYDLEWKGEMEIDVKF